MMVVLTPHRITPVDLIEAVERIRTAPLNREFVRALGIGFGSEYVNLVIRSVQIQSPSLNPG